MDDDREPLLTVTPSTPPPRVKIQLLEVVALTVDLPEVNLRRGQVGTVVDLLDGGKAFEVEFGDRNGRTYASLGLCPDQVMVLRYEPVESRSRQ